VNIVASNKDNKYTAVPPTTDWKIDNHKSAYFHYCDNETVHGTQHPLLLSPSFPIHHKQSALEFPQDHIVTSDLGISTPIVADMSSNFFSRPVDVSKYGVIYGGT